MLFTPPPALFLLVFATNFFFIYPLAKEEIRIRVPLRKTALDIGVLFEYGDIWRRLAFIIVLLHVLRAAFLGKQVIRWSGVAVIMHHTAANTVMGTWFRRTQLVHMYHILLDCLDLLPHSRCLVAQRFCITRKFVKNACSMGREKSQLPYNTDQAKLSGIEKHVSPGCT